jgi:hypothetical protein
MAEFCGFRRSLGFAEINAPLIIGKFSQLLGSAFWSLACQRSGG